MDGPLVARPGYVALIPGGPQEFPNDPIGEAHRISMTRADAQARGQIRHVRRIPKEAQGGVVPPSTP